MVLGRAGLPGSLNPGYLLEVTGARKSGGFGWIAPVPWAEQRRRWGTAVLGSLGVLQPLAGHLPGLRERTSSSLLSQELGRGLQRPLLLSSVLFPARNNPVPGVRGSVFVLERDC